MAHFGEAGALYANEAFIAGGAVLIAGFAQKLTPALPFNQSLIIAATHRVTGFALGFQVVGIFAAFADGVGTLFEAFADAGLKEHTIALGADSVFAGFGIGFFGGTFKIETGAGV